MGSCSNNFCLDSQWQATCLGLMMNLRYALGSVNENSLKAYEQVSKHFTSGAVCMIYVVFIFVLLAVCGSAIKIYEFLLYSCIKKAKHESSKNDLSRKHLENSAASPNGFESFFSCFCVLKNTRKLLSTNKEQFECVHGIRFLNSFWIILLHICMGYMSSIRNVEDLKPLIGMWSSQLVLNGQYAVDAFFVLGGFLNAYLFFNNYDKNNGNVSWHYFYLKRFVRLTPVYMVVLGFYTFLFPYMGNGPIWPNFDTNPVCKESWWWNLLYINNFKDYSTQCMEWCWYLAADMQFYIISPIFFISLLRAPKLGYVLTIACITASCFANFVITKQYNLVDGFSRMEYHSSDLDNFLHQYWTYFDLVYIKPYTRLSSYLVAILLAHYLYKKKLQINCSRGVLLLGWISANGFWLIAYFALFKREESITENAIYNGIKHLFYSIGLSWILFVCLTGQGGLVNKCLSWKVFAPLAKLSYCAYLIHPLVMMRYYQTAEYLEDLNVYSLLSLTAYVYFWTYVFSFITSLLFEFPFLNLLDLVYTKSQKLRLKYKPEKTEL